MMARPAEPMRSGMRAPLDSPSRTSGRPRFAATCFTCLIFFMLITDDDAPSTVKSFDTSATSRPAMRAKPATLPSAGGLVAHLGADTDREHARLDEAVRVDQVIDALARVEVALGFAPGELFRAAHREHARGAFA